MDESDVRVSYKERVEIQQLMDRRGWGFEKAAMWYADYVIRDPMIDCVAWSKKNRCYEWATFNNFGEEDSQPYGRKLSY